LQWVRTDGVSGEVPEVFIEAHQSDHYRRKKAAAYQVEQEVLNCAIYTVHFYVLISRLSYPSI